MTGRRSLNGPGSGAAKIAPGTGSAQTRRSVFEFTGVNLNRVVDGRIVEHGGAANLLGPLAKAGAVRLVGPATGEVPKLQPPLDTPGSGH